MDDINQDNHSRDSFDDIILQIRQITRIVSSNGSRKEIFGTTSPESDCHNIISHLKLPEIYETSLESTRSP